jgi:hypothetical protein
LEEVNLYKFACSCFGNSSRLSPLRGHGFALLSVSTGCFRGGRGSLRMKPPPRRVEGRLPGGHSAAGEGSRASGVRPSSIQLVACGVGTALDDDGQMLTATAESDLEATCHRVPLDHLVHRVGWHDTRRGASAGELKHRDARHGRPRLSRDVLPPRPVALLIFSGRRSSG